MSWHWGRASPGWVSGCGGAGGWGECCPAQRPARTGPQGLRSWSPSVPGVRSITLEAAAVLRPSAVPSSRSRGPASTVGPGSPLQPYLIELRLSAVLIWAVSITRLLWFLDQVMCEGPISRDTHGGEASAAPSERDTRRRGP